MARIPNPVVGRTQPDDTPLALRRSTATAEAFGANVGRSLGNLGKELLKASLALKQQGKTEAQLRVNLEISAFQVNQEELADDYIKQAVPGSPLADEYSEQFVEEVQVHLNSIKDAEARQNAFARYTQLYASMVTKVQMAERKRNVDAANQLLEEQRDVSENVVRNDPSALNKESEHLSDSLQQARDTIGLPAAQKIAKEMLGKLTLSAKKGECDQNPGLCLSELHSGLLLSPGVKILVQAESGSDPEEQNDLGYSGLYQMGAPRMFDLGLYTPGEGENVSERNGKKWSGNKWSGRLNIPGHPNVKTIDDYLASEEAQHTSYIIHNEKIRKEIVANNFDRFIGEHVRGTFITEQSLRNMIHFGGVGGTRAFLNGTGNARDRNGRSMQDYAMLGSEGPVNAIGDLNKILTPEQKEQLRLYGEAARDDQISRRDSGTAESARRLKARQDNNYAALLVGITEGKTTKSSLLDALSSGDIRSTDYVKGIVQFDKIESDTSAESSVAAAEDIEMLRVKTIPELYEKYGSSLTNQDMLKNINRLQKVTASGGTLNSDEVGRARDRVTAALARLPGFEGSDDIGQQARYSNALIDFHDAVLEGEDAFEAAEEVIDRYRQGPLTMDDLRPPSGMSRGTDAKNPTELKIRAGSSYRKIVQEYTIRRANEAETRSMEIDWDEYFSDIDTLIENRAARAAAREKAAAKAKKGK